MHSLYSPFVIEAIKNLEAGQEYDKTVVHPEEGVFDMEGGVNCGTVTSIKAADVIDERKY